MRMLGVSLLLLWAVLLAQGQALLWKGQPILPLRTVTEWLGGEVKYQTDQVAVTLNGKALLIALNAQAVEIDGKAVALSAPLQLQGGQAYIGGDLFTDGFATRVTWEPLTRTVTLVHPRTGKVLTLRAAVPGSYPGITDKRQLALARELHSAAATGNLPGVQQVLQQAPALVEVRNVDDYTPLHRAAEAGHAAVVAFLLEHGADAQARIAYRDLRGIPVTCFSTVLYLAAAEGHAEVVSLLLQAGADPNSSNTANDEAPLHVAAAHGHVAVITALLAGKAEVNIIDAARRTPLHAAVDGGHLEAARSLLQAGAPVDARESHVRTALHIAAQRGDKNLVQLLLDATAEVNARDDHARTPLALARAYTHQDAALLLQEAGGEE